jgi:xeroderma pigmentosum group C-complementing protein
MRRPHWLAEKADLANFKLDDRTEKPLELSDFRRAAKSMQGSADVGAQLFCCLLRALGVETRLVCSLQPLGFASAAEVGPGANTTPVKKTVYLRDPIETPKSSTNAMDGTTETIATQTSRRITRIGQPRSTALPLVSQASPSLSNESTRIERPSYPVLWVEAFNAAHQKWIVVDPLATHTVAKPSRLEPGINDPKNCMTYAVAFEENGVVRDVTRRYTKAYTAKTRRIRVESTEHGTAWFRKALRLFRRPGRALDRDTLEDVELTAKEASEGMPKNVQDFKNHPLYALVRHLRRNEIIHPKTESGRINVGTANNPKFENVYRRNNVHIVKSADKWFRLGREIKMGEQPLKHAMPRRGTRVRELPLGGEREGVQDVGVGLYAVFQTQLYNPPPVVNGKIPKNQYGNIDIYVPSMIPEAAVWVRMPEAKHAAKTLKIDYADAVTGFDFKGRHGTARLDGVVVAEEYHEAMEVVCDALREMSAEERKDDRKREVLRLWKRFLVGMREIDRIDGYLKNEDGDSQKHVEPIPPRYDEEIGGYLADDVDGRPTQASTRRRAAADPGGGFFAESDEDTDGGGGFLAESNDDTGDEGGFVPEEETVTEDDIDDSDADNDHGGFVPHRDDDRSPLVPTQEIENLLPKVDGTNETEAEVEYPDANPFGFANIRIPALMRVASIADGSRASGLPGIVRSMKRPQLKFLAEEPIMVDENMMPTHLRINRPIEQLATATHTNPKTAPDTMPINVEPAVPTIEQEQSQPQMNKPEFMSVGNTEIDLAVEPEAPEKSKTKSAMHKDELPVSSYEYDEDMLDEDPEDEDAEPEWLL